MSGDVGVRGFVETRGPVCVELQHLEQHELWPRVPASVSFIESEELILCEELWARVPTSVSFILCEELWARVPVSVSFIAVTAVAVELAHQQLEAAVQRGVEVVVRLEAVVDGMIDED